MNVGERCSILLVERNIILLLCWKGVYSVMLASPSFCTTLSVNIYIYECSDSVVIRIFGCGEGSNPTRHRVCGMFPERVAPRLYVPGVTCMCPG